MNKLMKAAAQFRRLEELADGRTYLHRLTPLAKLGVTLVFIITVISFDLYDISGLWQFALYPLFFMIIGEIPFAVLETVLLIALPLTLFTGLSNVFFNQNVWSFLGPVPITYGMISGLALVVKCVLTVSAVTVLMATTKLSDLCNTLRFLHVPDVFTFQLLMCFRYIRVLLEEAEQMSTAYRLRNPQGKGIALKYIGEIIGQLLLRSYGRANRIYAAMLCRGFQGTGHMGRIVLLDRRSLRYMVMVVLVIAAGRFLNMAVLIENILK